MLQDVMLDDISIYKKRREQNDIFGVDNKIYD